jgi:tetratricopeptide (TPR) repeat protein
MELDMELDRVGSPPTEGLTFAELWAAGAQATACKQVWNAYGYLRDALSRAALDPVEQRYGSRLEQVAMAVVNCGTGARALGRYRYAMHEFMHVHTLGSLSPRSRVTVLHRLGTVHLNLDRLEESRRYSQLALDEAEAHGLKEYLAFVYESQGLVELNDGDPGTAIRYFQKACQES